MFFLLNYEINNTNEKICNNQSYFKIYQSIEKEIE